MRGNNRKKIIFFVLIALLAGASFFGIWLSKNLKELASTSGDKVDFVIESGEGGGDIAQKLEEKKLIKSSLAFTIYLNYKKAGNKLMAGQYSIPQNLTIPQVAEILTKGKIITSKITIPEGWDNERIGGYLEEKGIGTKAEFLVKARADNYRNQYSFLIDVPREASLEGFLYPDTYQVSKNPTQDEIINAMLKNFDKKYASDLREKAKNKNMTTYELVNLASVVEREVAKADDRRTVAGVFLNRLEIDMPLESCATIQYILKSNAKTFTYEETRTPSSYNTYINKGLPKGPIANPGIDSIKAVLDPQESNYLYFLSSNGITYFAKTLDEHNANKAKYLK